MASEQQYAGVFESVAVGLVRTDIAGTIVNVNQAFCDFLGYSQSELAGKPHSGFVHPDYRAAPREFDRLASGEIRSYHREKLYLRKDGTPVWAAVSVSRQHDETSGREFTINAVRDITRRKQVEDELRARQEHFHLAMQATRMVTWEWDSANGRIVTSDSLSDVYGLPGISSVEDAFALGAEEDRRRHFDNVRLAVSEGREFTDEFRIVHPETGEVFWLEERGRPVFDEEGTLDRVVGVTIDVTDRRRFDRELRESEARYRSLAELSPEAILVNVQDRIVYANPAAARLLGASDPQEIIGKSHFDFIGPEYHETVRQRIQFVRERQQPTPRLDYQWTRLDGSVFDVAVTNGPIEWRGEQAVLVLVSDITDRKRTERALQTSQERLQLMVNVRGVGVIVFEAESGLLIDANEAFLDMFGYSRRDIESRSLRWRDLVPSEYVEMSERELKSLEQTGSMGPYEKEIFHNDGSRGWMVFVGASLDDGTYIEYCMDVSDRKRIEAELRQLNESLDQRVRERTAELEEQADRLRKLANELVEAEQRERSRMAEILHDELQQLLVAARMQVSRMTSSVTPAELERIRKFSLSLLGEAIESTRSFAATLRPPALYESGLVAALGWFAEWIEQAHGLSLALRLNTDAEPGSQNDAILLFESVRELLLNTVKYSGVTEARMSLERGADGRLRLTVEDDGVGFDIAEVERRPSGVGGFGLFSIRERMRAMGGECDIRSAPGQGCTVTLIINGDR